MAKRPSSFERKLRRIEELKLKPGAAARVELVALLAEPEPYLAGAAAAALAELGEPQASAALAAALLRLIRGEQPDGGCMASDKVVSALLSLHADEPDAYRAGIAYVRRERSGTEIVDSAVHVRIACATGLIQLEPPGAVLDVTPLLADPEPSVREGAARAIAQLRSPAAAALLHLQLLHGDPFPEVLGACLDGLLACDPTRYLPVAEEALATPSLHDLAALAIGESRAPGAFAVLERALATAPAPSEARALCLALALLRTDAALEALFAHLEHGTKTLAHAALEALAVHRHTPAIAARVHALTTARPDSRSLAARLFGPPP